MQIEMEVAGLTLDPVSNAPIVLLKEKGGERVVPIWIGIIEASAIAFELEKVHLTRPMTHDLLKSIVEALGGTVDRVTIADLRENTYFAVVRLSREGQSLDIDARPSDAIALALRTKSPILCESQVLEQAHLIQRPAAASQAEESAEKAQTDSNAPAGPRPLMATDTRSWQQILEDLKPEDFGKYEM
jgi:bifunctional DNase/RNase